MLASADADERLDVLPRIAATNHMLPHEMLASCRTVVVFFIPFREALSNGNIDGKFPSDGWGLSLALTNDLFQHISEFIPDRLAQFGYQSELTPATYNFDPQSLTA